jgi:subtilisin family serine protease
MPQGYACVNNTLSGPNWSDDNSHGTHVAGTIGALNNSYGVVGVAPGTPIYPVKVLNSTGSGSWSQIICGIDWVTANGPSLGIKAANMSLGGSGSNDNNCGNSNNDALHQAICRSTSAGITYAVAAGNSSTNFSGQVPAAYPEVLTVTAIADGDGQPGGLGTSQITCRSGETDDTPASFTNYAGSSSTDQNHTIAAPGVCIYSTDANGDWMYMSGTSMATPHITGTVALCLASTITGHSCSGMTPSQIVTQLRSDANAYNTAHTTPTPYGYGFEYSPSTSTSSCNKRNKCTTTTKYYGYLTYAGGDYY